MFWFAFVFQLNSRVSALTWHPHFHSAAWFFTCFRHTRLSDSSCVHMARKKVWKKCWFAFIAGSVLCAVTSASLSRERLDMSTPFVAFHVSSWRCGTFFYSTPLYHSESLHCDLSIPLRISKQRRLSHKTSRRICYSFKPCRQARSSFDGSRIVCFMFENVPRISRCFVVLVCLHTPSLYAHRAYDDGNQ